MYLYLIRIQHNVKLINNKLKIPTKIIHLNKLQIKTIMYNKTQIFIYKKKIINNKTIKQIFLYNNIIINNNQVILKDNKI